MSSLSSRLLAATAAASVLLVASVASADVAPPDDQKSVSYSFAVHGITDASRIVFAYPCGLSNGAPKDELRVLENGKAVEVGRRGGSCTLYAIEKSKYDEFAKTYTPATTSGTDPKLASFAATAVKCSGAPSPVFVIPKTDARNAIHEDLDVQKLDASSCTIASRTAPTNGDPNDGDAIAPGSSGSSSNSGGCSVGGSARSAAPWLVALAVPFIVFGSRRRRKA